MNDLCLGQVELLAFSWVFYTWGAQAACQSQPMSEKTRRIDKSLLPCTGLEGTCAASLMDGRDGWDADVGRMTNLRTPTSGYIEVPTETSLDGTSKGRLIGDVGRTLSDLTVSRSRVSTRTCRKGSRAYPTRCRCREARLSRSLPPVPPRRRSSIVIHLATLPRYVTWTVCPSREVQRARWTPSTPGVAPDTLIGSLYLRCLITPYCKPLAASSTNHGLGK